MNLTIQQAAVRLGVSPSLVYAWCRQRLLTFLRFGRPGKRGKIVIPEDSLAEFAQRHTVAREAPGPAMKLKHIRI